MQHTVTYKSQQIVSLVMSIIHYELDIENESDFSVVFLKQSIYIYSYTYFCLMQYA